MRNILFAASIFVLSFSGRVYAGNSVYSDKPLRNDTEKLLIEWVDTLLICQRERSYPALDEGSLCPACAHIHGWTGDMVLSLMYLANKTGDDRYLPAAKKLMRWTENVHHLDGLWINDVRMSDWSGTTVFVAIALYEAVYYHGHLLNDSACNHWKKQLLEAGEFIMKSPQMYSRRTRGNTKRLNNVSYSVSVAHALQAFGEMFNRPDSKEEARIVAPDLKKLFTVDDFFLHNEGPKMQAPTKNGCLSVDLSYNIEESLPNLAYYTLVVSGRELLSIVKRSMNTHLEFMLPDGVWDSSWGTRSFKWTYWGGRMSNGFMGGYYTMVEQYPEYLEAIRCNIQLLKKSTNDGLFHTGRGYQVSGISTCIHHTFGHAKILTAFLELPSVKVPQYKSLPHDDTHGVKYFQDIHTWLIVERSWRSMCTGFDAEYKVRGIRPIGGAISLLWYGQADPVFITTTSRYALIETPNMQSNSREYIMSETSRVEMVQYGITYSNLSDLDTDIVCTREEDKYRFHINTHLMDADQQTPAQGVSPVTLDYVYSKQGMLVVVGYRPLTACFVLPVIVAPSEVVDVTSRGMLLQKKGGISEVICVNGMLKVAPTDEDSRISSLIPGFFFVPLQIFPEEENKKIQIEITYN